MPNYDTSDSKTNEQPRSSHNSTTCHQYSSTHNSGFRKSSEMETATASDDDGSIRRYLDVIQSMIDISANRLEGLRTQCETSAELTQQEIRFLESKLVRMFTDLLMTRAKLPDHVANESADSGRLRQWLRIVGLSADTVDAVLNRCESLETLIESDDFHLHKMLTNCTHPKNEDETRRLVQAMTNLRRCRQLIENGDKTAIMNCSDMFWDSWDRHNNSQHCKLQTSRGTSPRQHRSSCSTITNTKEVTVNVSTTFGELPHACASNDKLPSERHHQRHCSLSHAIQLNREHATQPPLTKDVTAQSVVDVLCTCRPTLSPDNVSVRLPKMSPTPSPPSSPSTHTTSSCSMATPTDGNTGNCVMVGNSRSSKNLGCTSTCGQKTPSSPLPPILLQYIKNSNESESETLLQSISNERQLNNASQISSSTSSAVAAMVSLGAAETNNTQRQRSNNNNSTRMRISTDPDTYNDLIRMQHEHNPQQPYTSSDSTLQTLIVPQSPFVVERNSGHATDSIVNSYSNNASSTSHGHRFSKRFNVMSTCDQCGKQMFFGLKCKACKFRCHKDCESLVVTTPCNSKVQLLKQPNDTVFLDGHSPSTHRAAGMRSLNGSIPPGVRRDRLRSSDYGCGGGPGSMYGAFSGSGLESGGSAGSSCNSSTPSSPALLTINSHTQQNTPTYTPLSGSNPSSNQLLLNSTSTNTQFQFPDVSNMYKQATMAGNNLEAQLMGQEQDTRHVQPYQKQSDATIANDGTLSTHAISSTSCVSDVYMPTSSRQHVSQISTIISDCDPKPPKHNDDTEKDGKSISVALNDNQFITTNDIDDTTATMTSEASSNADSDRTAIRLDSNEEPDEQSETDSPWSRQNSVSLKEWDIPFEELIFQEKLGDGRFGTVHHALWHGSVAVKILKKDYLDNEAFKMEVATFKKTRHENVVLFMGACINPQAIVTSLCKGHTLYTHIHLRKDRFSLSKTTMVAQQISLGMGYLHARNITHRDLKTKNIFLENGKVIITDFGLFSATKLEYDERNGLRVPNGWLVYLSPELMHSLQPKAPEYLNTLPFSRKSDIYAFGTVWYELLCGEFPFKSQPPEAVIFQIGRGMKQTLANLQAAIDVKDILMTCWAYDYNLRPDFSEILKQLEKLPKKRLERSPSHPVHLSRSAESVF